MKASAKGPSDSLGYSLSSDGRILIISHQYKRNFPHHFISHPKLVFWEPAELLRKRSLPPDVELILMTKFRNHIVTDRLGVLCSATSRKPIHRGASKVRVCQESLGTGEVKRIVQALVGVIG